MSAGQSSTVALVIVLASCAAGCGENTPHAPSCTYGVVSSPQTFTAAGGQGSATVTTGASCTWTAAADAPWVSLSGAGGTGPATLQFGVAANGAADPRKATLAIAGQALPISQDGRAPCEYAVSPSSLDMLAAGGSSSLAVTSATGCTWTAKSNDAWVTVTTASGTGSGTVGVIVSANGGTGDRQTALEIAGRTVALRQAGAQPPPPQPTCEYAVSPVEQIEHWHSTGLTVNVSTAAGCNWTAGVSESWLHLDKTTGQGPGSILVTYMAFTEDTTRRAAVQVRWPTPTAGQNVWVTQEGCRYGVAPSASFAATGGTGFVTVVTQPVSASCALGCPWTATSNAPWIRVTSSMPRAGDDAFFYQVEANGGSGRVGTITVAGRTHTVTQSGK